MCLVASPARPPPAASPFLGCPPFGLCPFCTLTCFLSLSSPTSPASSSKFGSSGNVSPGSSQLSEQEQGSPPGSEQEEELPEAGSVTLTLRDVQEPLSEPAKSQEASQEGEEEEAKECGLSQPPGEGEDTPKAAPEHPKR